MNIKIEIDQENLIQSLLHNLNREELFDFITKLDLAVADYDFTEELRDHFTNELRKEDDAERVEAETYHDGVIL